MYLVMVPSRRVRAMRMPNGLAKRLANGVARSACKAWAVARVAWPAQP